MKKILCRDLGADCDFVAHGETSEEVKKNMMEHAMQAHPEAGDKMSPEEMDKLMDEKMQEE